MLILDEPTAALEPQPRSSSSSTQVRRPPTRRRRRLHLPPPPRGRCGSPTASPSCATAPGARHARDRRDGRRAEIVELIVGRALEPASRAKRDRRRRRGEPRAGGRRASAGTASRRRRSTSSRGEIVGLAGVAGNGQTRVPPRARRARAASGERRPCASAAAGARSARTRRRATPGSPTSRPTATREGLCRCRSSVRENASPSALSPSTRARGFVSRARERARGARADRRARRQDASTTTPRSAALSGGNQQKVVLGARAARAADGDPRRRADPGRRRRRPRGDLPPPARGGRRRRRAVLVVSSDAPSWKASATASWCSRAATSSRELAGDEVTEQNITGAALTSTHRAQPTSHDRGPQSRLRPASCAGPGAARDRPVAAIDRARRLHDHAASFFLTGAAFTGIARRCLAALAFSPRGQQVVMIIGGIDLSVGPLVGLLVVIAPS